jgi:hypothetical protein
MAIYAALGVDEIWRYDNGLQFLSRREGGSCEPIDLSRQLPFLNIAEATRQIEAYRTMDRLEWMRAFRRLVRELLAPRPPEGRNGADQP